MDTIILKNTYDNKGRIIEAVGYYANTKNIEVFKNQFGKIEINKEYMQVYPKSSYKDYDRYTITIKDAEYIEKNKNYIYDTLEFNKVTYNNNFKKDIADGETVYRRLIEFVEKTNIPKVKPSRQVFAKTLRGLIDYYGIDADTAAGIVQKNIEVLSNDGMAEYLENVAESLYSITDEG